VQGWRFPNPIETPKAFWDALFLSDLGDAAPSLPHQLTRSKEFSEHHHGELQLGIAPNLQWTRGFVG
jgi:hypothetical protein